MTDQDKLVHAAKEFLSRCQEAMDDKRRTVIGVEATLNHGAVNFTEQSEKRRD